MKRVERRRSGVAGVMPLKCNSGADCAVRKDAGAQKLCSAYPLLGCPLRSPPDRCATGMQCR